jgi:hypothetical protein
MEYPPITREIKTNFNQNSSGLEKSSDFLNAWECPKLE